MVPHDTPAYFLRKRSDEQKMYENILNEAKSFVS